MNMQPIIAALTLAVTNAESRLYSAPVKIAPVDKAALLTELKRYRMGFAAATAGAAGKLPQYDECGSCGHLHRPEFRGDCRDDSERFTDDEIEAAHEPGGFIRNDLEG